MGFESSNAGKAEVSSDKDLLKGKEINIEGNNSIKPANLILDKKSN